MSRSELHDWECTIKSLSGDNADKMLDIAQDIYNTAFVRGKNCVSLDQQPWKDCISRQNATAKLFQSMIINSSEFGNELSSEEKKFNDGLRKAVEIIRSLPNIQPQPKSDKWIDVSEPPKEDGKYLVSRRNEENIWVEEAYYSTTSRTTFPKGFSIIKDNFSWRINNVIAWMPKPQPYKAESEE